MLTKEKIDNTIEEIQQQYLADETPWIIGYSGGKDSTTMLQLVLYALAKLPKNLLHKEIHVLSNDTLVENPAIVQYVENQLVKIQEIGRRRIFNQKPNLFKAIKVTPKLEDRFWMNLIGKGYPSPNRWFRWCTDRLKINPTNDYILEQVSKHGKAIILLGTRKSESANRRKSMEKYDIGIGEMKLRNHSLPNAWVYAPIAEWTTKEIWTYLLQVPSFWGGNNRKLVSLYKNASPNATECPLVIDKSTPSCGNSRFGCWVCTVVKRDKSMENLIDNGEEWMEPMLFFRDFLAAARNDETKRMNISRDNRKRLGPFHFEVRADLLRQLLEVEKEVDLPLIGKQELAAIQVQWNYDGNFDYNVSDIYESVYQKPLLMNKERKKQEAEEMRLLEEVAKEHGVNPDHIKTLMVTEKENAKYLRRRNIYEDIKTKIERFVIEREEAVN